MLVSTYFDGISYWSVYVRLTYVYITECISIKVDLIASRLYPKRRTDRLCAVIIKEHQCRGVNRARGKKIVSREAGGIPTTPTTRSAAWPSMAMTTTDMSGWRKDAVGRGEAVTAFRGLVGARG